MITQWRDKEDVSMMSACVNDGAVKKSRGR